MSALVGYASSDEDDDATNLNHEGISEDARKRQDEERKELDHARSPQRLDVVSNSAEAGVLGPMPGPSMPSHLRQADAGQDHEYAEPSYDMDVSQDAAFDLTVPPVPNFSIPPSPPGSPNPTATAKFAQFLKLKGQGMHFNAKLASAPALKNPSLFEKLRKHAGIEEEEQYASTLREDLAVPTRFPPWAYADELNRSQAEMREAKEAEIKRNGKSRVQFVAAKGSGSKNV